jgi:hypothetical protein
MTSWSPKDPKWLYPEDKTLPPPPSFPDESTLGKAWQRLQVLHTPFRTIDPDEYRWIVDWLAELEQLFLEHQELEPYYRECYASESEPPGQPPTPTSPSDTPPREVVHVATLQAQFMEEVFYALALDRHANAPDNRGWMNLFRRWGRSKRFNERLDTIRSLLTLRFLTFYDDYLLYYPCRIDEDPIPHPWDSEDRRRDPRTPDTFPERTGGSPGPNCEDEEAEAERKARKAATGAKRKLLPGLYLDSGIRGRSPGAAPASPRDEVKTEIDRPQRPRQEDSGGEAGGSAPTRPNK